MVIAEDPNGLLYQPIRQERFSYDGAGNLIRQVLMADANEPLTNEVYIDRDMVTEYYYYGAGGDYPGLVYLAISYYGGSDPCEAVIVYDYDGLGRRDATWGAAGNVKYPRCT